MAAIPLARIAATRSTRRYSENYCTVTGDRLFLPGADGTTVDIDLTEPVDAVLPAFRARDRQPVPVSHVSLYVDDTAGLVAALRANNAARTIDGVEEKPDVA